MGNVSKEKMFEEEFRERMDKFEKGKKRVILMTNIALSVVAIVIVGMITLLLWTLSGTISINADCQVSEIDYREYPADTECRFIIAESEDSVTCALPRDFHCKGAANEVSLTRALLMLGD